MIFDKYRLEDITDKIGDGIHGTPKYDETGDYYFVNGNNLIDGDIVFKNDTKRINEEQYLKNKRDLNMNTLLVSINGTLGNVAKYNNEKIILGKSACYINIKNNYNVDYVYFVFKSPEFKQYLQYCANGTTIKNVPLSAIRNYEISIPSKTNQDKIVKMLKNIEDKIKLNNKLNNNLQEISKQLYKRWFVDFEFPNVDGQPYKSSGGKMIDSELGEIPENWNVVPFKDIAETTNGYSYKGNELVDESSVGMVTIKNFDRNGGFKIDGYKSLSSQKIKEQCIVDLFDVAVAHTDLTQNADIIGNPIMILNKSKYDNLIISMDLVKVTTKNDIYNNFMIFEILNSNHFKKFALGYVSGTTVLHLNKNCLKDYAMAMPDNNLIKKYSNIVEKNYNKIAALISENIILEQLRDTLLPKLMNGEIDLDNIEV